ncbi:MAG: hypothetical protein JWM82_2372 [Myxococcales bacterium]|nr:hypothetical protein [Myxococcales bacterium]
MVGAASREMIVVALAALASAACGGDKTGAACTKDSDCGSGSACVYKIADKCAATANCQKLPTGPTCDSLTLHCGCDGKEVDVPNCGEPPGYATAPIAGQWSATCPSGTKPVETPCTDTSECGSW